MSNSKLLLVDDEPLNLKLYDKMLKDFNFQVIAAANGQECIEKVNEHFPDLILMDWNMPVMDGIEALEILKKDEVTKDIPVLMITGVMTSSEDLAFAMSVGAIDFLKKPFDKRELLARVKTHLELKYAKDQLRLLNEQLELKVQERTRELWDSNSKLEAANSELETLDKAKSDFLRIISHEIRTPLNGIIGFIGLLKDELIDSKLYEMIDYLEISAERLEHFSMISLRITELRTKKQLVTKEFININTIIEQTKDKLSMQIGDKKISVLVEGALKKSCIYGEPELVKFCFESIMKNAIYYSPNGSEVTIRINSDNDRTVCSFIDQGKGFTPIALKCLFQMFAPGEPHIENNGAGVCDGGALEAPTCLKALQLNGSTTLQLTTVAPLYANPMFIMGRFASVSVRCCQVYFLPIT
jgi:two-component system sensor histidine kinase/response regulator